MQIKKVLITGITGFVGSHLAEYIDSKNRFIDILRLIKNNKYYRGKKPEAELRHGNFSGITEILRLFFRQNVQ